MLDKDILRNQLVSRRVFIIGVAKIGMLFLLAGRMFYMQFIKKDEYRTLSDKNRISIIIIPPMRGKIFDCHDRVLAKNKTSFRLLLDKNTEADIQQELKFIAELLELDNQQIAEIRERIKLASKRIPVLIVDSLDWKQISIIEERKPEITALFIDAGYVRFYPLSSATAHLLGYLGKASPQQQEKIGAIAGGLKLGKTGIEGYYDDTLRGKLGYKQLEINAFGKYVRKLAETTSIAGQNLHLNIDGDLQEKAISMLDRQGSSAVIMDTTTGAVKLLASMPSFDPNNFDKLSNSYWQSVTGDPLKPLINKTIHALYPPGSIFKIITLLAALEYGIDPHERVHCSGSVILGNRRFNCANRSGHGSLDLTGAIKHSCNIYMYVMSARTGADRIIEMAMRFGLGQKTGIDMAGELSGFVPTQSWKKKKFGNYWSLGDTYNLSIGQGFLLVTPMQLARLITTIATSGRIITPSITVSNETKFQQIDLNYDHLNIIKEGLYQVVNLPGGSGYSGRIDHPQIKMAGKTGTAQVVAKKNASDDLSRANIAWGRRNHAIFAGYAPFDDPKWAILVYYDHGGGGGRAAAPIAGALMNEVVR